jgi:hypothetical protein
MDYQKFEKLVEDAIALNELLRRDLEPARIEYLGDWRYAREHCTVRIDVGRHCGKTEYIKRRALAEDVIVCSTGAMKRAFSISHGRVYSASELLYMNEETLSARRVYIDDPTAGFSHCNPDSIVRRFKHASQSTFVLLGE